MHKVKSATNGHPAPMNARPARPGAPSISQEQLERYRKLKPLAHEFARLDRAIKAAMREGAAVEPGFLALQVRVRQQRRRLQRYLFERLRLSKWEIKQLRTQAPQVAYRTLAVVPSVALAQQ